MRNIGAFLGVLIGAIGITSSANAGFSNCKSIAAPMERLACYDKAANQAARTRKPAAFNPVAGKAYDASPTPLPVKALPPAASSSRYWLEAEGGIYGFSKNLPILAASTPPSTTGPTPIPTAPGFIGLFAASTITNPLATGAPPAFGGGGSYRMGYWLDQDRTMAVEGSAFFVQGKSKFDLSQAPTTVTTSTFVNTTPGVVVGLFDDTTTTSMTQGAISDQIYGADVNFRMKAPRFANFPRFDVMVGMRYAALDEKLTASVNSTFSRTFEPALGLPPPVDFSNSASGSGSFRIRNNFIGPQIGFNAEQHWGRFWVANESKVAVGPMIERLSVSGSTFYSITPTMTDSVAGIPLQVNAGAPPVTGTTAAPPAFGLFAQGNRSKTVFAVVPSGTVKVGYEIVPDMLSLTLAYNYLYMSNVGRIGDQITTPFDIRQSSFFAQGITLGAKAEF